MASETTQIIKEMAIWRAKYHEDEVVIEPMLVCPHPENRGGDPVKALRLRAITAGLARKGFCSREANANGVCVCAASTARLG